MSQVKAKATLDQQLTELTQSLATLRQHLSGSPRRVASDRTWRPFWWEEVYHSSALAGNPLTPGEVRELISGGRAATNKPLWACLEVQGYANALRWVYEAAFDRHHEDRLEQGRMVERLRKLHHLLMAPLWSTFPPPLNEEPGQWRFTHVSVVGLPVTLPTPEEIPARLESWAAWIAAGPGDLHPVAWATLSHARLTALQPFPDGNGRTARLFLNYLLLSQGYPPAILQRGQRERYATALARAVAGQGTAGEGAAGGHAAAGDAVGEEAALENALPLIDLVARSVRDNLHRLLAPYLAADVELVPLSDLAAGTPYGANYLRHLAEEGRLRAVREGGIWLSSGPWLEDYLSSRSPRGRRPRRENARRAVSTPGRRTRRETPAHRDDPSSESAAG